MVTHRFWYNNGKIENITSDTMLLSKLLLDSQKGLHICMRTSGTRIPFYNEQLELLREKLKENEIILDFGLNTDSLKSEFKKLLHRNRVFKGSLIHIFLIPIENETGLYSLNLFTEDYPDEKFLLNQKGCKLGWLKQLKHPGDFFMKWALTSHESIAFWDKELQKHNLDAAYLANESGKIVECTDSSIFVVKGSKIYTPSISLGLSPRAIRQTILRIAPEIGLSIIETDKLEPGHLNAADEIFIADDIKGIRWIVAHNTTRFFRTYSEIFVNKLNREWEEFD